VKVREIMHQGDQVPVAMVGSGLRDAIVTLSKKRFGCVCIVDGGGRLAGIITDGDLARNLDRNLGGLVVDDIMTRTPKTVDPDSLSGEAIAILDENRISALVVVEDGKPVGIVHFHDLLRIGVA
jgi:arabinose-5-phosphate isomerase